MDDETRKWRCVKGGHHDPPVAGRCTKCGGRLEDPAGDGLREQVQAEQETREYPEPSEYYGVR